MRVTTRAPPCPFGFVLSCPYSKFLCSLLLLYQSLLSLPTPPLLLLLCCRRSLRWYLPHRKSPLVLGDQQLHSHTKHTMDMYSSRATCFDAFRLEANQSSAYVCLLSRVMWKVHRGPTGLSTSRQPEWYLYRSKRHLLMKSELFHLLFYACARRNPGRNP